MHPGGRHRDASAAPRARAGRRARRPGRAAARRSWGWCSRGPVHDTYRAISRVRTRPIGHRRAHELARSSSCLEGSGSSWARSGACLPRPLRRRASRWYWPSPTSSSPQRCLPHRAPGAPRGSRGHSYRGRLPGLRAPSPLARRRARTGGKCEARRGGGPRAVPAPWTAPARVPPPLRLRPVIPAPTSSSNMAMTADGKIDTVARRGARISGRPTRLAWIGCAPAPTRSWSVAARCSPRTRARPCATRSCCRAARQGRPAQPSQGRRGLAYRRPGRRRSLDPDSRFLHDGGGQVFVFTSPGPSRDAIAWLEDQGAEVVVRGETASISRPAWTALGAGPGAAHGRRWQHPRRGSVEAGLVDELQLAIAPLLFGGETAPDAGRWPRLGPRGGHRLRLAR